MFQRSIPDSNLDIKLSSNELAKYVANVTKLREKLKDVKKRSTSPGDLEWAIQAIIDAQVSLFFYFELYTLKRIN